MPIKVERTTNPSTGKPVLKIEIDNGDLAGFDGALDKWTFRDEESMIRYMVAVLLRSQNKKLYADDGVKKVVLEPTENLLATSTSAGATENDGQTESK